jgi:hypothetical protein
MTFAVSLKPLATALCGLVVAAAQAHDTWFAPGPAGADGALPLTLGTGNQFPVQEFGLPFVFIEQQGCRTRTGSAVKLALLSEGQTGITFSAGTRGRVAGAALTCWAQLVPLDIEIEPAKVAVYLKEIKAPQPLLDAWASMQSRGLPWQERYTKHARIELAGAGAEGAPGQVNMGMDVLLTNAGKTLRAGDTRDFQILRDGIPLPDQAVELRGDLSPIGFWRKTDAQGRAQFTAPLAGQWVLRAVDLRLSTERLSQVPGRSASHTAAMRAMSHEPPTNTPRR